MKDLEFLLKKLKGLRKRISEGCQISWGINASIKLPHPFVFLPGHRIMRLIRMYA